MKSSLLMPCPTWAEKLAARHHDDLSPSDRVALQEHVAFCSACAAIHSTYQTLELRVHSLPAVEPLPDLSLELLQRQTRPVTQRWLQSLLRAALTHFSQRTIYASSGSNTLYALQGNNGPFLWAYKTGNVVFASPGMEKGQPYLTPFDAVFFLFTLKPFSMKPHAGSFLWKR